MSLKKNIYWNIAGAVVPLAVGAASIAPLIEHLGVELFGVLTILWVIVGYFSLFDFGVGRALTQQISSARYRQEEGSIDQVVKAGLALTLFTGILGGGAILCFSHVIAFSLLNLSDIYENDVFISLLIASGGVPITTVSAGLRGALEGKEKFYECNMAKMFLGTALFGFPLLGVVFVGGDIKVVAIALVLARVVGLMIYLFYTSKAFSLLRALRSKPEEKQLKSLLAFGGWMSITNLLSPILVNIDRFFISNIMGGAVVAFYTLPFEFLVRALIIPSAVGSTLLPRLSSEFNRSSSKAEGLVTKSVGAVFLLMLMLVIATILLASPILSFMISDEFAEKSSKVAVILSVGVLFNGVGYIYYTALHSLSLVKLTAKLHVMEFFFYIPILYCAVGAGGVEGAAFTWLGRTVVDTILLRLAYRKAISDV